MLSDGYSEQSALCQFRKELQKSGQELPRSPEVSTFGDTSDKSKDMPIKLCSTLKGSTTMVSRPGISTAQAVVSKRSKWKYTGFY